MRASDNVDVALNQVGYASSMNVREHIGRPILSAVLAAYVFCLFVIMSPPSAMGNALITFIRPVISWMGTITPFGIMGPEVFRKNVYYSARIRFVDGSTKEWQFPHYLEGATSDWQHQKLAFYFLWQYNLASENSNELQLSVFRYIARLFHDERNEPVQITIYEHLSETPDISDPIHPLGKPTYIVREVLDRPVVKEDYK